MAGDESRGRQMARSLAAAARARGADDEAVEVLTRGLDLAMAPRIRELDDDHHPAYLHPGRSPLILLRDVGPVEVPVLVMSSLQESQEAHLRVPLRTVEEEMGPATADALESIPLPGDERLVERLLALGRGSSLAALAERLDHLRHLHLREDLVHLWAETHAEVARAWLPFAARIHAKLARRYDHWARTFAKRI